MLRRRIEERVWGGGVELSFCGEGGVVGWVEEWQS